MNILQTQTVQRTAETAKIAEIEDERQTK